MDGRRDLAFGGLDEVMPEVERLLGGHSVSGAWSLGQILHHLSAAIRLTLDPGSVPDEPPPGDEAGRVSKVRRRLFFRAGRFPEGAEVPHPAMIPPIEADERAEAESLGEGLRLLGSHPGPFPAHPYLGRMSAEEWRDFHRIHCAHHLGFARVVPGASPD